MTITKLEIATICIAVILALIFLFGIDITSS